MTKSTTLPIISSILGDLANQILMSMSFET